MMVALPRNTRTAGDATAGVPTLRGKCMSQRADDHTVGAASTYPLCSCHTGERKDWKTLCVKSGETHELYAGRRCCFAAAAAAAAAADATTTTISSNCATKDDAGGATHHNGSGGKGVQSRDNY